MSVYAGSVLAPILQPFRRAKNMREDDVRDADRNDCGNNATNDPRAPARRAQRRELAWKLAQRRLVDVVTIQTKHAFPPDG